MLRVHLEKHLETPDILALRAAIDDGDYLTLLPFADALEELGSELHSGLRMFADRAAAGDPAYCPDVTTYARAICVESAGYWRDHRSPLR